MTAQPIGPGAARLWTPDPARQRRADHTIEDVLALPDDAPRVELRDGVMIVVPSPSIEHQTIAFLIQRWLWDHAPGDHRVTGAVGVVMDLGHTLEPDVLVVRSDVAAARHYVPADQVILAVEVVSPGTKRRDRLEKPADYAAAGIPHYWRVEQDPVHVYAYELGAGDSYQIVADSDTELVLSRPFDIRLPIDSISL